MNPSLENAACPLPAGEGDRVQMAHGGGGRMMRRLLAERILPRLTPPGTATAQDAPHDSAVFPAPAGALAFTSDSFVIHPLRFPGGDIGTLAVCGTVNDLAMAGARPLALSCSLILEEGFPLAGLDAVLDSLRDTAQAAGVQVRTGDTKVVEKGHGHGVYINTTGVGEVLPGMQVRPERISEGDVLLLSGDIGRHGIAVMGEREHLSFEGAPPSDCALLHEAALALAPLRERLHCLRDLTRGGLAAALVELAEDGGWLFRLQEENIPVHPAVAGACELLGLDPLHVANEGRFLALVSQDAAEEALAILARHEVSAAACRIGQVRSAPAGRGCVELENAYGSSRLLDLFSGEQLPRIC